MLINLISKTVLKKLAVMEKRNSIGALKTATMKNMAIMTIINTGFVILLEDTELSFGKEPGFNIGWYKKVGSQILTTMMITIVITIVKNFLAILIPTLKRCCDRGCKCDSRRTNKFTQPDYEDINTGGEFPIDLRYSGILTYVFVVMMYSAGMPILYPMACVFFFVYYWFDKTLMIKFFRRPPQFDNYIALHMLSWFKVALFLHIAISLWVF